MKIVVIIMTGCLVYLGLYSMTLCQNSSEMSWAHSNRIQGGSSEVSVDGRWPYPSEQSGMTVDVNNDRGLPDIYFAEDRAKIQARGPVYDFVSFPCAYELHPKVLPKPGFTCVRTVAGNLKQIPRGDCVSLRYPSIDVNSPICVYNSSFDGIVSTSIRRHGQWEPALVTTFMKYLLANPQVEFLDMGCNVGVYTVTAAKLARKVVCVDPMVPNVKRIMTSLKLGKIQENVTIIWNAIADTRRLVSLLRMTGNVGGTEIRDNVQQNSELAETVTMDDLMPLYRGKQVAIKMDIQEQELAALQGGQKFFSQVDVKLIQLEFVLHKARPSGLGIIAVLKERGFDAFKDINGEIPLNQRDYRNWPYDVYFIKTKT